MNERQRPNNFQELLDIKKTDSQVKARQNNRNFGRGTKRIDSRSFKHVASQSNGFWSKNGGIG